MPYITIRVEVPALDKLVDFLEGRNDAKDQAQVDDLTAQVEHATDALKASGERLKAAEEASKISGS